MRTGLPEEYYVRLRQYRWRLFCLASILTLVAAMTTWGAFLGSVPLLVPVVVSAVLLLHALTLPCALKGLGVGNRCCARVIPFFQRGVSGPCTFLSGTELARNWSLLNSVALESGAEPLSSFGLGGDSPDEDPRWCDSNVARATIAALLRNLPRYAIEVEEIDLLWSELNLLNDKLEAAQRQGILFCLHLKTVEYVCPQEEALRQGSYF